MEHALKAIMKKQTHHAVCVNSDASLYAVIDMLLL